MAEQEQKEKIHCPHCGFDVTSEPETEYGIFCPKGCGDFWSSEAISGAEIKNYRHNKKNNMMMRRKP